MIKGGEEPSNGIRKQDVHQANGLALYPLQINHACISNEKPRHDSDALPHKITN